MLTKNEFQKLVSLTEAQSNSCVGMLEVLLAQDKSVFKLT
jgi:hypothetical protein